VNYDGICTVDEGEGQGLVEVLLEEVDHRRHPRGGVDLAHALRTRKGDDVIDPGRRGIAVIENEASYWSEVKIG